MLEAFLIRSSRQLWNFLLDWNYEFWALAFMSHLHSRYQVITPWRDCMYVLQSNYRKVNVQEQRLIWQTVYLYKQDLWVLRQVARFILTLYKSKECMKSIYFLLKNISYISFPHLVLFSFSRAEIFEFSLWQMTLRKIKILSLNSQPSSVFLYVCKLLRIQDKEYETSIILFGSINTGREAYEPKVKRI